MTELTIRTVAGLYPSPIAHSPANRAVSADSGYNLLSNNAIKMRNKFYLICHSARSEMRMNKGTPWVFFTKYQQFIIFSMNMGEKPGKFFIFSM